MFNQLLNKPKETSLEIDRIHRSLGPLNPNPAYPRDVICCIHFFNVKSDILQAARSQESISFNGTPVMLLTDLSRKTLLMRKALKPVTDTLQAKQIKYRWGFPFHLSASHNGKSSTFRTLRDMANFRKSRFQNGPSDQQLQASGWEKESKKKHSQSRTSKSPSG